MKTHFGADPAQRLGQEVCPPHPQLDCPERMFGGLAAHAHNLRVSIQPRLHPLEDGFVFPTPDPPFFSGGTLRLHRASRAYRAPIAVQSHSVLDRCVVFDQPLTRRAAVLIVLSDVNEVFLTEPAFGFAA